MSRIVRYAYCASLILLITSTMSSLVFAQEEKAQSDGYRFAFATAHLGKGGHLGVALSDLTPELRTHFGVPEGVGVMVSKVLDDSPALEAGIEVGDIITSVDGEDIGHAGELAKTIRAYESGETVLLEAWRDGKIRQITATLTESEGPMRAGRRAERAIRKIIRCTDGEDCDVDLSGLSFGHDFDFNFDFDFGCENGETCEVTINCDDGNCECSANGASIDCPELPHFESLHEQH